LIEVLAPEAICIQCAAAKNTPLGRCPECGHTPEGPDREIALLCSSRFLDATQRLAIQERIRRGETLNPSATARANARAVLAPQTQALQLDNRQLLWLLLGNILLTPMLGYALWFRARGNPAGRQALLVTLPCSLVMAIVLFAWRYYLIQGAIPQ